MEHKLIRCTSSQIATLPVMGGVCEVLSKPIGLHILSFHFILGNVLVEYSWPLTKLLSGVSAVDLKFALKGVTPKSTVNIGWLFPPIIHW